MEETADSPMPQYRWNDLVQAIGSRSLGTLEQVLARARDNSDELAKVLTSGKEIQRLISSRAVKMAYSGDFGIESDPWITLTNAKENMSVCRGETLFFKIGKRTFFKVKGLDVL